MKRLVIFILTLIVMSGSICYILDKHYTPAHFAIKEPLKNGYIVQKGTLEINRFNTEEEAIEWAKKQKRVVVINEKTSEWIYSSLEPFIIFSDVAIHDFTNFENAITYAKENGYEKIYYKNNREVIWEKNKAIKEKNLIDVPLIQQYPELARGCEVTSLAMLLSYSGKEVDKLELANKVKKENTTYKKEENGKITYGNPYEGFVGDMYNMNNNGYGVYHGPISELAKNYVGDRVIDITGSEFKDLLYFISKDLPVWIITNATYAPLDEKYFKIWHTPTGIVKTTNKLHSVVVTGYDENNIYINDPLAIQKNKSFDRKRFEEAWIQMGNQAIVILN